MRLLNSKTRELEEFPDNAIPKYAILSHTWGEDEVSFQDRQQGLAYVKAGYTKIKFSCAQAVQDGLDYVWVDTCCIDKSSSAELSEAINSMYRWYQKAQVCYAYLADVSTNKDLSVTKSAFASSRWFTRGWTLQELIAPSNLVFYSSNWDRITTKSERCDIISEITSIDVGVLEGTDPGCFSIAQRMSWASKRNTTRVEDIAYCLLGIFGVNMALLYGEGERSFIRLREEIMKDSDDHSLFAWKAKESDLRKYRGLLATSPEEFQNSGNIIPYQEWSLTSVPYAMTNKGLRITLNLSVGNKQNVYNATINCPAPGSSSNTLGILLKRLSSVGDQYCRVHPKELRATSGLHNNKMETIYVRQKIPAPEPENFDQEQAFLIRTDSSRHPMMGFSLSRIDTPAGQVYEINPRELPIPKGTNGWVAVLSFRHEDPKNRSAYFVLLGFTPDLGVSIRIISAIDKPNSEDLFNCYDPRDPSVLERIIVLESGFLNNQVDKGKLLLRVELGLRRVLGRKLYAVDTGMSYAKE
jgi:hypothetical protein